MPRSAVRPLSRAASKVTAGILALCFLAVPAHADMPVCTGGGYAERALTCVVDGDSGWELGGKWRLADIDAPEIERPECRREQRLGFKSRDRLRALMADGYSMQRVERQERFDRYLVRIRLADGRDAGAQLVKEGLAQAWSNTGSGWCGPR